MAARALVELGAGRGGAASRRARPIVLAPRRPDARVAAAVAPGVARARRDAALLAAAPSAAGRRRRAAGADQRQRLGRADRVPDDDALRAPGADRRRFLVHDRPIQTRTDDSVVRVVASGRWCCGARAATCPTSLGLPVAAGAARARVRGRAEEHVLRGQGRAGVGGAPHRRPAELRDAALLRRGRRALRGLFAVEPEVVAHDLHPEYLSTKVALERADVELVGVQHHHAHLAACLAEHGETGPALGAIYDGTGTGPTGRCGAASCCAATCAGSTAWGRCSPVRMPGGEAAIRQPWRMACAWPRRPGCRRRRALVARPGWAGLRAGPTGLASPLTSSVGRLFDAVAALCGLRSEITYEGQAAIELEAACDEAERGAYPFGSRTRRTSRRGGNRRRHRSRHRRRGHRRALPQRARRRHGAACAARARDRHRRPLRRRVPEPPPARRTRGAAGRGRLRVLVPERLPPGDGGISYGQAAVAAASA